MNISHPLLKWHRPFLGNKVALKTLAAVAIWGLGACTSTAETLTPMTPIYTPSNSVMGNFLAARHATYENDMGNAADFYLAVLELGDATPELMQRAFMILTQEGRIDDAMPLARQLLAQDQTNTLAAILVASEDIKAGNYPQAVNTLDQLNAVGINRFMVPLLKSWALQGLGKTDEAIKLLEPLNDTDGLKTLHDMHLALILDSAGRTEEATKAFTKAGQGDNGSSLRLIELYAAHLERKGAHGEAQKLYQEYAEKHPNSLYIDTMRQTFENGSLKKAPALDARLGAAEAMFGLASSLRQQNAQHLGLFFGRVALALKPDFPIARILLAELLEGDQRLDQANTLYKDIPATSPFSWPARQRLALNLNDLKRTDESVRLLETMAQEKQDAVDVLVTLGDILRGAERYQEASNAYERALKRIGTPEAYHWSLLYSLAITYERQKMWDKAEPLFLKTLELRPDQPHVLNYLGYSWIEMGKNVDRARQMIELAVKQRPRDGYIVDSLGWVLFRTGAYDEAVNHLERAVELHPEDPIINDHLGDAYWKVGRNREARFQWRRSLSLNPEIELEKVLNGKLIKGLPETVQTKP